MRGIDVLNAGVLAGTINYYYDKGKGSLYNLVMDNRRFYLYDLKLLLLSELAAKKKFIERIKNGIFVSLTVPNRRIEEVASQMNWDVFALLFAERGKMSHEYIEVSMASKDLLKIYNIREWLWKNNVEHAIYPLTNKIIIRFTKKSSCRIILNRLKKHLKKGMLQNMKVKSSSVAVVASKGVCKALIDSAKELLGPDYYVRQFFCFKAGKMVRDLYKRDKVCVFGSPTWRFLTLARDFGYRIVILDSRIKPADADLVHPYADNGTYKKILLGYLNKIKGN